MYNVTITFSNNWNNQILNQQVQNNSRLKQPTENSHGEHEKPTKQVRNFSNYIHREIAKFTE